MCYSECGEGFEPRYYGEEGEYAECWTDCNSEEETETVNDFSDPLECKSCGDAIEHCSICTSDDFGQSVTCVSCLGALIPDESGLNCIPEFCHHTDDEDPTICEQCEEGYIMVADTTQCVEECPLGFRTELETNSCERLCEDGEYIDLETRKCVSCAETYPYCDVCDAEMCLECADYSFDFGQQSCSPCTLEQIPSFLEDGEIICTDCWELIDNCQTCFSGPESIECAACYFNDISIDGECLGCGDKKFPTMNADGEMYCEYCENQIPNCYQCDYDEESWELECEVCREEYFIDEFGGCTTEICRVFADDGESCLECNELNEVDLYTELG